MSKKQTYAVVLIPDDGGFRVRVPALPEVNTQGKDRNQALERVAEAIELAIEHRLACGEPVPIGDNEVRTVTVEAAE
jgi:predicted RNase H-like HicB family nuclease